MKFVAGSNSIDLADKMSEKGLKFLESSLKVFSDGELQVTINDNIVGEDVTIVQTTFPSVHNSIFELSLIADTLKRKGVRSIQAVVPYLSYSRQDRPRENESNPLTVISKILKLSGIEKLFCFDLHSERVHNAFEVQIVELSANRVILPLLNKDNVVVSPDQGGISRVKNIANLSGCPICFLDKERFGLREVKLSLVSGAIEGRDCYIIDDMIDGGGTIIEATNLLLAQGAKSVSAFCTHPILGRDAVAKIERSPLQKLFVTNTIDVADKLSNSTKIEVLDIVDVLLDSIVNAH